MDKIDSFREEYYFLSNFYPAPVTYDGLEYCSSEAAFQAQKTLDMEVRKEFCGLSPSEAKSKGRWVHLRSDWEQVKEEVMCGVIKAKFMQNPGLKAKLIATGDAYLEEGNSWGDRTWGTVNGVGKNLLGKALMGLRQFFIQTEGMPEASVPDKEGTVVVLERSNGWFGGYMVRDGRYEQIFNTDARTLFMSIKNYTDKGHSIRCVGKEMEAEFMKGRTTLEQVLESDSTRPIWRYETAGPFQMGGPRRTAIATMVNIHDYDTVELEKGFAALVVKDGPAKGVYELTSGGLVGDTVEEVNADILACDDLGFMEKQIKDAAETLHDAVVVTNERFGLGKG